MKGYFFIICLLPSYSYAASDVKKSKLNDKHQMKKSDAVVQGAFSQFEIAVSKYNWYGKKKSSNKKAMLIICLRLQNADQKDGVREEAQKKFLTLLQKELVDTKNVCPTHMQKILATILLKSAQSEGVVSYGKLKSCNFRLKIGNMCWNGSAKFDNKVCHLHCTREKVEKD